MNVSFLLHFYQPSNQFGDIFKKITQECYIPLIKFIKENRKISITGNLPLSLLAQFDQYGYDLLLKDIKDLVEQGRLELMGSGAYHPLLTKLPSELVYRQIILNELAQGFYFGSDRDFEGEDCYMIKNLKGFFPPELAITGKVLEIVADMGYDWVVMDENGLPENVRKSHSLGTCYKIGSKSPRLIIRDRELSNLVSFKRNLDLQPVTAAIIGQPGDKVIALDAETFGHHFKDGVYFFGQLAAELCRLGVGLATVSHAIDGAECKNIESVVESTWSTESATEPYPMWENSSSSVNVALWELSKATHEVVSKQLLADDGGVVGSNSGYEHHGRPKPVWKDSSNPDVTTKTLLTLLKLEQSDAFWWSTGVKINDQVNSSRYMVASVLDYYKDFVNSVDVTVVADGSKKLLTQKINAVEDLLESLD